jgi:SNF2 family DNA or RNA helicase
LNGNQAKIAELIHSVQATRRYAVTANLIVNSAEDAWNPLRWLQLESRDWATFEHETIKTRTINPSPYVEVKKVIGSKPEGMRKLRRLIADNMIARHDMLDLPPKIYQDIIVTLKPEEAKFYEEAARSFEYDSEGALTQAPMLMHDLDLDEGDMIPNQFVRKLRLKQITSSIEVFLGKSYPSSKIVALKELIETATDSGKKVLVGSQFRSVVAALERELKDYNPAVIHGGVTTQAAKGKLSPRGLQQEKFQTDPTCRVFIGSVAACREGLTLTAGSVVCHIDKEWSPVYVEQFEGRAQRLTQTSHVLIYSLKAVLPNGKQTVDFDIEDDLDRKDRLISELVR